MPELWRGSCRYRPAIFTIGAGIFGVAGRERCVVLAGRAESLMRPRAIPRLNRFAAAVASRRERVDWSHAIFASPRLVRFEEMEYALPRAAAARRCGRWCG